MEEEKVENETPTNEEETEQPQETPVEESETPKTYSEEEMANLKKQLEEAKKYGENQKIRAEKAEKKPKDTKEATLTPKELIALRDVHEEDAEWLINFARQNNLNIADAKKDKFANVYLRERGEERKTAEATAIKSGRSFKGETPEEIVAKARRGELSDSEEDIDKLVEAENKIRLSRVQK